MGFDALGNALGPLTAALALLFAGACALIVRERRARAAASEALGESRHSLLEAQRWAKGMADSLPALISYVDRQQIYRFTNAGYDAFFNAASNAFIGKTMRDLHGAEAHDALAGEIAGALAGTRQTFERRNVTQGREVHVLVNYVPDRRPDGSVEGFYVMVTDITEQRRTERALVQQEHLLRTITDNLPVLISYIDSDETLRFMNATGRSWLGLAAQGSLDRPLREVIGAARHAARQEPLQRALAGERVEFEFETQLATGLRHIQNVYVPDTRADGSVAGIFTLSTDITALKLTQRRLDTLARIDTLTGLPNRRQFDERLREALRRSQRDGPGLAVMFLDIDHFKAINDSLGHAGGDAVLREFGARLTASVRETDVAARLAGDEFVVLLEGLALASDALRVAQQIVDAIRVDFDIDGVLQHVTTSLGVAFSSPAEEGSAQLMRRADQALYEAKQAGRDGFRLAPSSLLAAAAPA